MNMVYSLILALVFQSAQPELNVTYAKIGETTLQMDIYRPDNGKKPTPAVVVIHGGAWMGGKRQDMTQLAKEISGKNMLAATVSYRLAPKSVWPAMLDDVQTAVRFLRANAKCYNIDPKRIGAAGASAGGHLALMLGVRDTRDQNTSFYPKYSSRVSAVFDICGPTDLSEYPKDFDGMFALVLGKPRKDASAEIKDASPINFVDKKSAPVFIYQGMSDPIVPPSQSQKLEAAYKKLGLKIESVYLEGIGHEYKPEDPRCLDAMRRGIDFLAKHLKAHR